MLILGTSTILAGKNERLIKAVIGDSIAAVESLLMEGADVHTDDDAPLFAAIINKNPPIARLLLKWNANVFARHDKALELAIESECEPMVRLIIGTIHIRTSIQDLTSEESTPSPNINALLLANSPIPFPSK